MYLKRISFPFLALAAGLMSLAACQEKEGTEPGSDTAPKVTVYQNDVPQGHDPDQTVSLRIVPNPQVEKMYLLHELKEAKDGFIAKNGESAYTDKVVSEGKEYEGKTTDLVIDNLAGLYAITVVAVCSDGAATSTEHLFKGIVYVEGGEALVRENIGKLSGKVKVERQSDANIFRITGLYAQLDPALSRGADDTMIFELEKSGEKYTCKSLSLGNAPFILSFIEEDGMLLLGYYDPVSYGSYCSVQTGTEQGSGKPLMVISMLILDNNAGQLMMGGQIIISLDELDLL